MVDERAGSRWWAPGSLAPLAYKDFALFQLGWGTTRFGRAVEETGALWLLYELTGSPALLGLLGLARALPNLLLGAFGGAIADRFDQRRILLATQTLGGLASLAGAILIATGWIQIWELYALVVFQATIDSFDGGARQALFPRLIPRALLSDAVTMNVTTSRAAQLVGPVVGGLAIASFGVAAPYFINAATYLAMIGAVLLMHPAAQDAPPLASTLRSDMWDALKNVAKMPVLRGLLLLEIVVSIVQINAVIITVFGREVLDVSPQGLGGLLAAPALGAVAALVGLLTFGHARRQGRFILVSGLVYAAGLIACGLGSMYGVVFGLLVVVGLVDGLMTVTRHAVLQLASPEGMRGRVMGLMGTITRGTGPVGEMQSGVVAGLLGPRLALVLAGVALGGAAALTATRNRSLWRFDRETPPTM